jgi:hypothetical protein
LEQLVSVLFSANRKTPIHGEWIVACLKGAWPKLLGEKLAAVCRPDRFEDSKLVIEVLDDNWTNAVKSVRAELLEKLRILTAGEVKSIAIICSNHLQTKGSR